MEKPADTQHPVHDLIKRRWSPRSFADRAVEPQQLKSLMEAARWAASAFNEQPWRFVLVTKDDGEAYAKAFDCLVESNQAWAKLAPVLMLTFTRETFTKNDKDNRCCEHDLGLAMGSLSLQAMAMGLFVHQMAGVDTEKMRKAYDVPKGYRPMFAAAIGYPGDPARLEADWAREAEQASRGRNPFDEFVFHQTWGQGHPLFT